jgi:hypothetical protein
MQAYINMRSTNKYLTYVDTIRAFFHSLQKEYEQRQFVYLHPSVRFVSKVTYRISLKFGT